MHLLKNARLLADYTSSLTDFIITSDPITTYNHMGANITDTVLQAGLNYNSIVRPRVKNILYNYSDSNTSSDFLKILKTKKFKTILKWSHHEKPKRILDLTLFFVQEKIEKEEQLRNWILDINNSKRLLQIRGIGLKSVDYLKNLVGISSIAVDRHIKKFIILAGLHLNDYYEIRSVVEYAADLLDVPRRNFDKAIWSYLSNFAVTSKLAAT